MQYVIFQMRHTPENHFLVFEAYDAVAGQVDSARYDKVWSGEAQGSDPLGILDDLWELFNLRHPSGYTGRSMSMSDVVTFPERGEAFYIDRFGFKYLPEEEAEGFLQNT